MPRPWLVACRSRAHRIDIDPTVSTPRAAGGRRPNSTMATNNGDLIMIQVGVCACVAPVGLLSQYRYAGAASILVSERMQRVYMPRAPCGPVPFVRRGVAGRGRGRGRACRSRTARSRTQMTQSTATIVCTCRVWCLGAWCRGAMAAAAAAGGWWWRCVGGWWCRCLCRRVCVRGRSSLLRSLAVSRST